MNFALDTRVLKFGLTASAIAYAVKLFLSGHTGSGVGMVILAILIGLTALRSIRMVLVAIRIQQQKMDKARKLLAGINPDHLWPKNRGQYWFLQGNLVLESSLAEAEKAFRKALEVGLKRDEEKAAVMLNLAAIQGTKGRKKEAKALLVRAKRLDKKGMLKADIRTIEQGINNPQTVMRRR